MGHKSITLSSGNRIMPEPKYKLIKHVEPYQTVVVNGDEVFLTCTGDWKYNTTGYPAVPRHTTDTWTHYSEIEKSVYLDVPVCQTMSEWVALFAKLKEEYGDDAMLELCDGDVDEGYTVHFKIDKEN